MDPDGFSVVWTGVGSLIGAAIAVGFRMYRGNGNGKTKPPDPITQVIPPPYCPQHPVLVKTITELRSDFKSACSTLQSEQSRVRADVAEQRQDIKSLLSSVASIDGKLDIVERYISMRVEK